MKMKKRNIGIFCLALLFVGSTILPSIGGTYADDVKESAKTRNDTEKGLLFLFNAGHLKDVEINETYLQKFGLTVYEGTAVHGCWIVFLPKISFIPSIANIKKGETVKVFKDIPELHTRILFLPNNQILFSMWFLGIVDIITPENARHFSSDHFSLDELVQQG